MTVASPPVSPRSDDVGEQFIDIEALFLAFRRRFGVFLTLFFLVFSLSIVVTLQTTPLYRAVASVIIDPQAKLVSDFESILSGNAPDSTFVDTEVELMQSRMLVGRVVEILDLVNDPEFHPELEPVEGFAAFIGGVKSFVSGLLPEQIEREGAAEDEARLVREMVVDLVLEKLNVQRVGLTYVIEISFTSDSAKKAAQIANEISQQYLIEQLEGKFQTVSRSNDWLNNRLAGLKEEVKNSEHAVELYRAQSGLLSAQGSSLTEQQISDLNSQLIIQKSELDEATARLSSFRLQMQRESGVETIGEVLSSSVIRDLRKQQSEVAARRGELLSRYGARHPEIRKIEREVADVDSQIQQEIRRIGVSLENEVNVARQKVNSMESGLRRLRTELTSNNKSLVRLRELERDAEASRVLYESFLGRFKETGGQESIAQADARIISSAALPTRKSSPNVVLNILLGCVLGSLLGLGFVVLAEILDKGITTGAQVESVDLPFLASVPLIGDGIAGQVKKISRQRQRLNLPDYIVDKPLSNFAESYRTIRSSIGFSNVDSPPKIVAITSALPGDGKTVSSYCLGRISSMSGSKTLIIDCDLRRRQLSKSLNREIEVGLLQYLQGEVKLSATICSDGKTQCDILPLAQSGFTPKDIFGSAAFVHMLEELRPMYDLIILDTAPVLPVAETRTIANIVDGVILAIKWHSTSKDAVSTAANILKMSNAHVIGAVLTQVSRKARSRYGYGDYGYYSSAYNKYYID